MRCQRCNVVMVNERFYGPGEPFWGWRCMLCGNISDPTILENRTQCASLAAKGGEKKNKLRIGIKIQEKIIWMG
jgi:hypothetical protein